jgi:hypothetical protein
LATTWLEVIRIEHRANLRYYTCSIDKTTKTTYGLPSNNLDFLNRSYAATVVIVLAYAILLGEEHKHVCCSKRRDRCAHTFLDELWILALQNTVAHSRNEALICGKHVGVSYLGD